MLFTDHLKFWLTYCYFKINKNRKTQIIVSDAESDRINHYIKIDSTFTLDQPKQVNEVSRFSRTGYAYDWYRIFDQADTRLCAFRFGEISSVIHQPSFCKSRPITSDNCNNILMPFNTVRHFRFVNDHREFTKKLNAAVWRGAAYQEKRKTFLNITREIELCNTADTSRYSARSLFGQPKNYLSLKQQLNYKFIFAIEGNDVATNLKWAMSSNSAVIMPRPTNETWFCESLLEPGRHFIEIRPDYADIEEKLTYYLDHPLETQEIISEANDFCRPFRNLKRQFDIATVVAEKYFSLLVCD